MSNLIQIGLDVTSFSEDKKKAMNEFISLFEKLDVYSEKVYSPVLGNGLLEFNKSVSDTNKIIDDMNAKLANLENSIKNIQSSSSTSAKSQTELSLAMQEYKKQVDDAAKLNAKLSVTTSEQAKDLANDYKVLTIALKEQAAAYQLVAASKGVKSPEAKASLAQYRETASIVGTIDDNLSKAAGKGGLFGGALSGAFSQLRNIAYILPGIGIAGIFNLAYEAIEKAASEMGLFNNKLESEIEFRTKVNESLLTTIQLNEKLYQQDKKLSDENSGKAFSLGRSVDVKSARGYDTGTILSLKKQIVDETLQQTDAEITLSGNSPETLF